MATEDDNSIDAWMFETPHGSTPFVCLDGQLMLDHIKEHIDDWMLAVSESADVKNITLTYRAVSPEKVEEWREHGLLAGS